MKRQAIDNGGWFDIESATKFDEDTYFDGRNRISVATGSQWHHEILFRTKKGVYILNSWSNYQGSGETWTAIDVKRATEWLIKNDYEPETKEEKETADSQEL